ncbi:MAG TPA: hypothetical protein VF618_12385 [Thermoanaerobaculia bacterium]
MTQKVLIFVAIAGIVTAFAANRPERRPGNLTPIQLISALGVWALTLANASAMAIAIRDGSLFLFCTVALTLATALILFVHDDVTEISDRQMPGPVKVVIDDVRQLLGEAPRLGMDILDAVVVTGNCPGIGVSVPQQGRVVVRLRWDVVQWLERHQQAGGAGASVVASFARFTVLHELAHVLNGDHRTFRFVRSVLIAHLFWCAALLAACSRSVIDREASATPLVVATSIVVMFGAQSLVARRFISERERLADWRAMQTLDPADAARLLERGGRRRATTNPTELEKLMIDLKAQAPADGSRGPFTRLMLFVWPEGDAVHRRAEMAADRAAGEPQAVRWAALMGMQSGLLSMSLMQAAMCASAPWIGWGRVVPEPVIMAVALWISGPAVTFCASWVDPGRMSVRAPQRRGLRTLVGTVFFCTFATSVVVLRLFHIHLEAAVLPPLHFALLLLLAAAVVILCTWMTGVLGSRDGGGELRHAPRSPWVQMYPVLAGLVLVLVPLSIAVTYWLAIGSFRSGHWFALSSLSFSAFTVSTAMARSTSAALRVIAPMALLDTPSPVYGFRIFWRDFYVDLSRVSLARAAAMSMAFQVVGIPFFVLILGLIVQQSRAVLSAEASYNVMFFGSFAAMMLIVIIPDRYGAFGDPSLRLADANRIKLFEKLLAAIHVVNPRTAERLKNVLSQWLRNDRLVHVLLPDARSLWMLEPLLILVRLARATGETALLPRWRDPIERSLRQVVSNAAVAVAAGQPPSLHWTALAVTIIDEMGLHQTFPFERMLDRIETLLGERLTHGMDNLVADIVLATRLLRRCGRTGPEAQSIHRFARSASIVSRPLLRQSLAELCELAELTGDEEFRVKLRPIVRSRAWEVLQLNPRKDVLLLLDCCLALARLGEPEPHEGAAALVVDELANRMAGELTMVVNR